MRKSLILALLASGCFSDTGSGNETSGGTTSGSSGSTGGSTVSSEGSAVTSESSTGGPSSTGSGGSTGLATGSGTSATRGTSTGDTGTTGGSTGGTSGSTGSTGSGSTTGPLEPEPGIYAPCVVNADCAEGWCQPVTGPPAGGVCTVSACESDVSLCEIPAWYDGDAEPACVDTLICTPKPSCGSSTHCFLECSALKPCPEPMECAVTSTHAFCYWPV